MVAGLAGQDVKLLILMENVLLTELGQEHVYNLPQALVELIVQHIRIVDAVRIIFIRASHKTVNVYDGI